MMKFIVNNCLSAEVERLFKTQIKQRIVIERNKILYDLDNNVDRATLKFFCNSHHIKEIKEEIYQ